MTRPTILAQRLGQEGEPLVVIDDFAADPDDLRQAAAAATFEAAGHFYPGVRAPLPESYFRDHFPVIAQALGRRFGPHRQIGVIDASFSIVTARPDALDVRQRVPHVDAYGRDRVAMVHYLSPAHRDGTAFFRHRATGFETIDDARAPAFFDRLQGEVAAAPPEGYILGDTPLFERIGMAEARYNRAILYRSQLLHSGAIAPDAILSSDPAIGRLTVTAFLSIG
ncbi:DUF6445 family protein [Sphingomonas sp. XXL09]|uniref:DUF6445 family protein n=1 Tax=Sphingomonas sp. XXL09 TaxID=3457787 RepID=UPI00406BBAE4